MGTEKLAWWQRLRSGGRFCARRPFLERLGSRRALQLEALESRLAPAAVTYASTDVPKPIPDEGTISSTLNVPDSVTVNDVNVHLNISHSYDADLDVFLIGPSGTRIALFTDVGGLYSNFTNTILDAQAPKSITLGTAPFTGSFRPEGLLSAFNGTNAAGTWTLEVTDDTDLDAGTLHSWSLEFNNIIQKTASFNDADGDRVIVKLAGPGSIELDGNVPSIIVTGSNAASVLSIAVVKAAGGDGRVTFSGVQAASLGSLIAPMVQLNGNLQVNTYMSSLSLWGLNGAVSAPGLGSVVLRAGGFSGSLDATAGPSSLGLKAGIRAFRVIGGSFSGTIDSAGPLTSFLVLKNALGNGGTVADSEISATAVRALRVAGTLTNSLFLAGSFPRTVVVNSLPLAPLTNASFVVAANKTVDGSVVKGPVTGATVTFYLLNPDGTVGRQLGQTFTDASASFTVNLSTPVNQPFLAVARAGSYVDEVTGQTVNLSASDELAAVLPGGTTRASITPLTNMAAALARSQAAAGLPLAAAVANANNAVAIQYNLPDIIGVMPVAANDSARLATAATRQRNYGLVLAGISQLAANLNVSAANLTRWLASDFADGILDGMDNGVAVSTTTLSGATAALPATTGNADLQAAINTFINSSNNLTNLIQAAVVLSPVQYGLNAAGRIYTTSTVLPAAASGQSYSATLTATGGTPAYTWTLTSGNLPAGFTLSPQGVISAPNTATILPSGTTMTISAPFVVTLSDAAGNTRDLELRITIVQAPPAIEGLMPTTAIEQQAFTGALAATGGTQPYYWYNSAIDGGFRPMWLSIDLDGAVHGTPPANSAGTYTFGVTVVDLIGSTSSAPVTLTVGLTPSIVVTPTSGLVTTEAGGTRTFTVVLHSQPTANVTIPISSSDTGEGTVSRASLTFTPTNWSTPQSITVKGVNDAVVDGDIAYTVNVGPAASTDPNYNGRDATDVAVTNKDNDVASSSPAVSISSTTSQVTSTDQFGQDFLITVTGTASGHVGSELALTQSSGDFESLVCNAWTAPALVGSARRRGTSDPAMTAWTYQFSYRYFYSDPHTELITVRADVVDFSLNVRKFATSTITVG